MKHRSSRTNRKFKEKITDINITATALNVSQLNLSVKTKFVILD